MRMVESGNGITFIPELATLQLSKEQKELVRPFAIPKPTREIVFVTRKDFIRHTVAGILIESIKKAVPKEMLTCSPDKRLCDFLINPIGYFFPGRSYKYKVIIYH